MAPRNFAKPSHHAIHPFGHQLSCSSHPSLSSLFVVWTYRDIPFDSTRWKNEKDTRPQMVRDLLDNHDLAGKPRESIDAMLGVPPGCDSVRKASTFALTVPVGINYGPFRIN